MGGRKKVKAKGESPPATSAAVSTTTLNDCRQSGHDNHNASFLSDLSHGVSKHVNFTTRGHTESNGTATKAGMHKSPSMSTLNRLERETYVLWNRPLSTTYYSALEILCLLWDFVTRLVARWLGEAPILLYALRPMMWVVVLSVSRQPLRLFAFTCLLSTSIGLYFADGPHHELFRRNEKQLLWCLWWIWLGVLSSVGFGTGLHTFVLYLGPHIAKVTLAAFECNSLDFPEPPYPADVTCPSNGKLLDAAMSHVSLWAIVSKVRLESLMWGFGTAIGELPPYFMAKAARISGEEPDDEEYREFLNYVEGQRVKESENFLFKAKIMVEKFMDTAIRRVGFFGILLFASVPNPFFDLAGLTCGHFRIPFLTFFGATIIGKAVIKMHFQMLCVVVAFSEHHVEHLVGKLRLLGHVGEVVQAPLKEFLNAQKVRLHRKPTDSIPEQASSKLELLMSATVYVMIAVFAVSLVNSLAQRYHKRQCDANKKKLLKSG